MIWVFGYGSLAHPRDWVWREKEGEVVWGHLEGHRRTWRVAIENSSPLYDQKHYLHQGQRPETVATLGIYSAEGSCSGAAIPVSPDLLGRIDLREKSYRRVDVSSLFSPHLAGELFTYYPRRHNRELFEKHSDSIALPASYLQCAKEAFRGRNFWQSTDPLPCPVREMHFYRSPGAV